MIYKPKVIKYLPDYFVLILVSLALLYILKIVPNTDFMHFIIITMYCLFYILWGILHHIKDKTFHFKIIAEYVLFALLLFFISLALL